MRALPLLLGLAACQEPFSVNRRELGPFRIAAVGVVDGVASAALWSGLGLYHDERPSLTWTLDGAPLGEGFDVAVPAEGGQLGLTVTAPDGGVYVAEVTARAAPIAPPSVTRAAVDLSGAVDLAARRDVLAESVSGSVAEGEATRLGLTGVGVEELTWRWMSAGGLGSLLELDPGVADVLAEELEFEDGVLLNRSPTGPGLYPQLVLGLDGLGGNLWVWADAAIGVTTPLLRHEGRLIPADAEAPPGLVAGTVALSDDLVGLTLIDVAPATEDDIAGTFLSCAPSPGEPFRLQWLAEGRCLREDLDGERVVLEVF
ncbi:MAG: hypothetical protein IPN01_00130 [Deltaproteobacteria bacterium]|nr:hypothetical protein [Deltaproteobacteria bacterium]